jgi:hypothetical protein
MSRLLDRMAAGRFTVGYTVVDGLERTATVQQRLAEGTGEGKYLVQVRPDD